mmetsp:Transcript_17159/g.41288  ORF Transcript_17159/g.41288 Transcript_17159/m.41288 type:complete len:246 (-) Transcript_17159:8-745(-)
MPASHHATSHLNPGASRWLTGDNREGQSANAHGRLGTPIAGYSGHLAVGAVNNLHGDTFTAGFRRSTSHHVKRGMLSAAVPRSRSEVGIAGYEGHVPGLVSEHVAGTVDRRSKNEAFFRSTAPSWRNSSPQFFQKPGAARDAWTMCWSPHRCDLEPLYPDPQAGGEAIKAALRQGDAIFRPRKIVGRERDISFRVRRPDTGYVDPAAEAERMGSAGVGIYSKRYEEARILAMMHPRKIRAGGERV